MGPGVIVAIVVVVIAIVFVASRNNKSGKQSRANQDFMKSMDEKAKQRNILATNARTKDDDYGFSPDNPIMESTVHSSYQFLDRLCTADGKPVTYDRICSMAGNPGGIPVIVDKYILSVDEKQIKELYICAYAHTLNIAPKGFMLK